MLRRCLIGAFLCAGTFAQTPVIVELFTSEGCSDCPPADILLAKLQSRQPVPGARIIALGEHVDYWDHQGWRDPFSSAQFSRRQEAYSQVFHDQGPYTPEMVVDGETGFVGSEGNRALQAIARAAREPKTAVRLAAKGTNVSIQTDAPARDADVLLAVTEDNLLSNVSAGENQGRKLVHSAVVRSLRVVGKARKGEPFTAQVTTPRADSWKPENLHAVVFLEDRATHLVLGATEIPLAP
jgi:hypothetical protein